MSKEPIKIVDDYSKIELRVLAHFSQDEDLCKNGFDIHQAKAVNLTKKQR